jgi:ATP-dependent DNA ligase
MSLDSVPAHLQPDSLCVAVQKALHLHLEEEKKAPKHLGHMYAVMEKFDGWYMYVDCINGVWQGIRSKTGRKLKSMGWYDRQLAAGPKPNQDLRLIFEATIPGMIFKDLNGRFNQSKVELQGVVLQCHDVLFKKYPHTIFEKRYDRLKSVVNHLNYDWMKVVKILAVSDDVSVYHYWYEHIISQPNGEGVILKKWDASYAEGKRDHTLMKIKCDLTLDLLVVGGGRGEGKYANTLGYLIVEEKDGRRHQVSGMSDAERNAWFENFQLINQKIVEVQAMKRLPNGSLREARFKAVRHDKTIEDRD